MREDKPCDCHFDADGVCVNCCGCGDVFNKKLKAQVKNLKDLVKRGNVHAYNSDGYHDKEDCVFCAALAEDGGKES